MLSNARPRISVVIPTYQCGKYIVQAVESALAQRYPTELIEIIVVDDGSTDDTAAVLHPLVDRIRYIRQANHGVAAARNAGIGEARGEFVAFLDADDYWMPDRLDVMLETLGPDRDSMITTDYLLSTDGRVSDVPYYRQRGLEELFGLPADGQLKAALEDNFIPYMMMVPSQLFERIGVFDTGLHYGEDWDLWLRCLSAGHRARFVPTAYAVYRYLWPGSSTTRSDVAKAVDRVRVLSKYRALVSRRRWEMAHGIMHNAMLREAWATRSYLDAIGSSFRLLTNLTYVRARVERPSRRKKEG